MTTEARDSVVPTSSAVPRGRSSLLWQRLSELLHEQRVPGEAARDQATVSVLDCGGGSGSLAVPLAALGAAVTVVDTSIDALAILRRRALEAGASDRVTALQGEAESLSEILPGQQFDLVLLHEVLDSVGTPQLALEQALAVLRPGGVCSVLMVNPVAGVLGRVLAGDVAGALTHFRRPTEQAYGLAAALADCAEVGFVVESVDGIGVFGELVPGIDLDRPGAAAALTELEAAAASVSPYREMASRLHLVLRRPAAVAG